MSTTAAKPPGIYREADGSRVAQAEALRVWTPIALEELIATAGTYNAVVTYKELALRVQEASGIRTRVLITNWIGTLLEQVAILAKERGEPPLTALCVRHDGTIGDGYLRAPKSVEDPPGANIDIEMYAAEHRLLCYQKYAKDLPADGGSPRLTPAVERRRRAKKTAPEPTPFTCPNCFVTLPTTTVCDYCGWSLN